MGYSIFSHSHLHLVGCKTNGQKSMVLINLQKPFDIINHKIKNVFCWIFSNSVAQFPGLSRASVYQFSSQNQKQTLKCWKYQLQSSATIDRVFPAGRVHPLAKNFLIPPSGKISPVDSHHQHHQIFILRHHQKLISSTK